MFQIHLQEEGKEQKSLPTMNWYLYLHLRLFAVLKFEDVKLVIYSLNAYVPKNKECGHTANFLLEWLCAKIASFHMYWLVNHWLSEYWIQCFENVHFFFFLAQYLLNKLSVLNRNCTVVSLLNKSGMFCCVQVLCMYLCSVLDSSMWTEFSVLRGQ